MIDLTKIQYRAIAVDGDGRQHDIRDCIMDFGWEENEGELSARISFTAKSGHLPGLANPGSLIAILASGGGIMDTEVARGYVASWEPVWQGSGDTLRCTCYDELYNLQKSHDNLYFPSGTRTRPAVEGILNACGIPVGKYQGPDVTHGKMKFNNRALADTILGLMDDAEKKSGRKCLVRASAGKAQVIPRGSNKEVYVFREDNTDSVGMCISTASLVTRVKVIGQADDEGRSSVEATLDGLTEYGIRQKIYVRGSDETIEAAKSAAQEILGSEGRIKEELTVQGPDVPIVRKGDLVYLTARAAKGYYYVKGVRHDADSGSMSMDLEKAKGGEPGDGGAGGQKSYNVGDVVDFHGGTHYISSYPEARGYAARAGKAKITQKDGSGKAHPWHLIHEDEGSNVYGWVDSGTFS